MTNARGGVHSILGAAMVALAAQAVRAQDAITDSLGPLYQQFRLTLDSGTRNETFGPLMYEEQTDERHLWGFPPFCAYDLRTDVDAVDFDVLPPAFSYDRFGSEYTLHLGRVLNMSGGRTQEGVMRRRYTVFPFFFHQSSPDPRDQYTAIFPFYGRLQNRFFRNEIDFILFPLYSRTTKQVIFTPLEPEPFFDLGARFARARGENVTTYNIVYPFFHLRYGEQLRGWQFWPFAGHEKQNPTTRTNGWGEAVVSGGYEKSFVLWPFCFREDRDFDAANPQRTRAVIPFFSSTRSPLRDSITAPWPLGYSYTDDRARGYKEWGMPWPFVVVARGEGKHTTRVFPFYSRSSNSNLTSNWYLWPAYKYNAIHSGDLERERTRIFFFLYSHLEERNIANGDHRKRIEAWPFFSWRRDLEGRTRFQMLSLLEPILAQQDSVEKVYSPLWALWREQKNPKTGAKSQSLLWNLYRRDTTPQTKKCSLLFGLFQYQNCPEGKRVRLFYIPVSGNKRASAPPSS